MQYIKYQRFYDSDYEYLEKMKKGVPNKQRVVQKTQYPDILKDAFKSSRKKETDDAVSQPSKKKREIKESRKLEETKNEQPFLNLASVKLPKKSAKKVIKQESFNTFGKNEQPDEESESLGNTSELNGSEMKGFDMDKKSNRKRAAEEGIEDLESFAKPNSILKVGSQTSKACRNVNFNESFKDYIEKDNMLTPMNNGRINTRFAQN